MNKPLLNIAELQLESWTQGANYQSSDASFGRLLGLRNLGISYNEVPAGKSSCPFHNHHVEDELFIVLEGEGTYRYGADSHAIKAGDVLGAPAGDRSTAHQIINTGTGVLRYFGISTMAATEVCEYPDSNKFGVFSRTSGNPTDKSSLRHIAREAASLDYWDGENIGEVK
ncbi:cupin domain-containing protein [Devosia sp. LjRoot16]|uniref:cupin domain-containing protein n=1 Tax=Devosia sp. LjRoot16 TaxID=3342271 RepID=UPI003ECF3412